MADLAASIAKAKRAGYSDAEIAAYIGQDKALAPKVQQARKAGYSDAEIVGHLGKVNAFADSVRAFASEASRSVAGVADQVSQAGPLGFVDTALKGAAGMAQTLKGRPNTKVANPFSGNSDNAPAYKPQTTAGEWAGAFGRNAINVFAPGSAPARIANVVAPAVVGETSRRVAKASGAGERGQAVASAVGGVAGAGLASVRTGNLFAPKPPEAKTADLFRNRAKIDPDAARAKAQEFRDAGVEPTLVDVAGDRGRRFVRATGVKSDMAGEALAANAKTVSASAKPAVMERTRNIGPMPGKSADDLRVETRQARDSGASEQYREPYQQPVSFTSEMRAALADEPGRQALQQARKAAVARMDRGQVDEIDSLLGAAGDPPTQVSAGTLDRIRIALRERSTAAVKKDQGAYASGLKQRQGMIDQTLDRVPALAPARADYRAKSQALDVLGKKRQDVFSTDPRSYGQWLESLPPEARQANAVAIRQEILDTLGGQRSSTFGTVDELATSQYAQANLRQALGPEADKYLAHLTARLDQVRNARMVDPNAGSRTAVLENDVSGLMKAGGALGDVARGNIPGLVRRGVDWLATRGVSEQDARLIAEAAIDPAKLPQVLQLLERQIGPGPAREFIALRNAALVGATVGATGFRSAPE